MIIWLIVLSTFIVILGVILAFQRVSVLNKNTWAESEIKGIMSEEINELKSKIRAICPHNDMEIECKVYKHDWSKSTWYEKKCETCGYTDHSTSTEYKKQRIEKLKTELKELKDGK